MLDLTQDYFQLFQLPKSYTLDNEVLLERYQVLQRQVHPDRYANASGQERRMAAQLAAFVNEAYQVLHDRLLRAKYLLQLKTSESAKIEENIQDSVFLMQQMEMREELEDLENHADPLPALKDFRVMVLKQVNSLFDELGKAFDSEDLDKVKILLQKIYFFNKLNQQAEELDVKLEV